MQAVRGFYLSLSCAHVHGEAFYYPGNHGWRVASEGLNNLWLGGREVRGERAAHANKIRNLNGDKQSLGHV
jgi:hypothetical protein